MDDGIGCTLCTETAAGEYRFFAGWRSDPFFFDTMGALNNRQFTGDDFFAGKDVCSIVLEIPKSVLGSGKTGPWHRTVDGAGGNWVQADRGALASQSVFLPGDEKAAYQAGQPADDAGFIPVFATNSKMTRDEVGPHEDLLTEFPYVRVPHKARSRELVAAST